MILNYIELENIRSYDKERIDFPRGITLFEGDIGSGKSTVLMGIEFALFGLGSQKPESLLSKKAGEGSVILEFEVDEKRYVVKRKLRRKGDSVSQDAKDSYLITDGQTEPLSPAELKQRVLQILKFNEPSDPRSESKIFRYAVFTPQEEMKQILHDTQKRLETIRKAFGVEDYKTVLDNAKILSQAIREKMAEFRVRFERLSEDEQSLGRLEASVSGLKLETRKLNLQKDQIEKQRSELQKEIDSLNDNLKQKERLELDLEKLEDQMKNKKSLFSNLESAILRYEKELLEVDSMLLNLGKITQPTTMSVSEIDSRISQLSLIRDKMRDKQSQLHSLDSDISKLEKHLGRYADLPLREQDVLRRELDRVRMEKSDAEKDQTALEKQKIELEKECKDIKKLLAELSELGAKCPHCENDLTPEHRKKVESERKLRLQEADSSLGQIVAKLADCSKVILQLQQDESQKDVKLRQIETVAPLREQWIEKTQTAKALHQEIQKLESDYVITEEPEFPTQNDDPLSYLRRLCDAQKEWLSSKQKITELESRKKAITDEIKTIQTQIAQCNDSILQLHKEHGVALEKIAQFSELDDTMSKKNGELLELEGKLDSMKTLLIKNNQVIESMHSDMKSLETQIAVSMQWREKHHKFSNYNDWLKEFFIPTVDKVEKQVLLSIQQNFDEIYRKWYSVLIDDVTKESRINEEFTPLVEQDGFEQDVDYLSGGEKTSIALAYRLTLNSMMRRESDGIKSNLLILDEPTDGFSKAQLSKVRNLLHELKSQQIILVSHEKELEAYVDNIFQITKDSGASKVVRLGS